MNSVFHAVAVTLNWIASVTGLTYNEINIVAYYIILPFGYVALIDRILRTHVLKIGYVVAWTTVLCLVSDFTAFSNALFTRSVDLLMLFSVVGLDYVAASVLICVILPGLAFVLLSLLAFPALRRRLLTQSEEKTTPP